MIGCIILTTIMIMTMRRKKEKPKALHTDEMRGSLRLRAEVAMQAYTENGLVMPGDKEVKKIMRRIRKWPGTSPDTGTGPQGPADSRVPSPPRLGYRTTRTQAGTRP